MSWSTRSRAGPRLAAAEEAFRRGAGLGLEIGPELVRSRENVQGKLINESIHQSLKVCTYSDAYTNINIYIDKCKYIHMYMYICICIYVHASAYTHAYTHAAYIYMYIHINLDMHIQIHMHKHMHIYT